MKVEVVEGKFEGLWKFLEAPEVVMRTEAGAGADGATEIRTDAEVLPELCVSFW